MSAPWETLLDWWFGTSSDAAEVVAQRNGLWFGKNVCQDADAGGRFGDLVNQALDGGLQEWTAEADGWLALILLLDQLPRMIYRDTPRAYAGDARAQRVVREGLEKTSTASCRRCAGCSPTWSWSTPRTCPARSGR